MFDAFAGAQTCGAWPVGIMAGTGGTVFSGMPSAYGFQPPRPNPRYTLMGTSIGGKPTFWPLLKFVNISMASALPASRINPIDRTNRVRYMSVCSADCPWDAFKTRPHREPKL